MNDAPVAVSFDCMNSVENPATFTIDFRDWNDSLQSGVRLDFGADGQLHLGPERTSAYELGRWYHVDIRFRLGPDVPGTYTLSFAPKGEPAEPVTVPFRSKAFKILTWFGFIAEDSDQDATFYIDNLHVDTTETP